MILPRRLDLDWLHEATTLVSSGEYRHRREGKTVAYLHLLLGEATLGGPQNNYLYIGDNDMITGRVMRSFKALVEEAEPELHVDLRSYNKATIGEQQYFFYPVGQLIKDPNKVRTLSLDRIFVDVDDATQSRLDYDGLLTKLFQELQLRLTDRRGDVV